MKQQNDTRQLTPLAQSIQRNIDHLKVLNESFQTLDTRSSVAHRTASAMRILEQQISEDEKLLPLELGMCEDFWNEGAGSVCSSSHTDPQSADEHFKTKYRQS